MENIVNIFIVLRFNLFQHNLIGKCPKEAQLDALMKHLHYNDVTMTTMASQITSLTVVYSTVYSDADKKKTSKLRVTGLCVGNSPGAVNSPHKGPVTRKMFPFDDVIMHTRK